MTAHSPPHIHLDYERILDCVHCGFCLSTCPTYALLGTEMDSPRGRIYLMRGLAEGKLAPTPSVVEHFDRCLGCRACETVCPAGVRYGHLLENARAAVSERVTRPPSEALVHDFFIEKVFPNPSLLEAALLPVRVGRALGVLNGRLQSLLPQRLRAMMEMLPDLPPMRLRRALPPVVPPVGRRRYRVGLLTGCVASVMFSDVNLATARVLAANGCEVVVPPDQKCCGALLAHVGNAHAAQKQMRQNVDVFEPLDLDAIITNAAGCGSTMKEYGEHLALDAPYARPAEAFGKKTKDISEFLADVGLTARLREPRLPFPSSTPLKVTYHEPCHLCHGQKIREQPRQLLRQIPGIELVELRESDWCCGSAGVYNLTQPELSRQLLARKIAHLEASGAEVVATGNPGCILQIAYGLKQRRLPMRVVHPVQLLDGALAEPVRL
ncbi:MAG: glycolate oxidase subunit GlcF [Abditibacteriales bacterium]|nr:glycolate oxidase subunit GlcF [Abditibacteriales bacterium]MDW8365077.1 glycolate oxidase subunit GlcF [Abditibacteriales bacterium]